MRALLIALLVPGFVSAQTVRAPAAMSLDAVLARHETASGPIGGFTTRRTTLKITGMAPFEIPVIVESMRPNLIHKRVTLQSATQVTGYDGRTAWRIDPFVAGGNRPMDVPAAELEDLMEEADFDGPLLSRVANGPKVEYAGPAVIRMGKGEVAVHSLKLTFRPGRETLVHLDATSFLEVQRVQVRPVMGRDTEITINISDYKPVKGVQVPHLTEIMLAGLPQPISIAIERVDMGVPMDRSIFARPQR